MPILLVLGAALLFGLVFGPQWWVRRVMQQHAPIDRTGPLPEVNSPAT